MFLQNALMLVSTISAQLIVIKSPSGINQQLISSEIPTVRTEWIKAHHSDKSLVDQLGQTFSYKTVS